MRYKIKKIPIRDVPALYDILCQSYPFLKFDSNCLNWLTNSVQKDEGDPFFGAYFKGILVGGMRPYNFKMNISSHVVNALGLGSLCTHFLYRKQGIATNLIKYYFNYAQKREAMVGVLYPFQFEFYKYFGFGHGSSFYQFRVKPVCFPKSSKRHLSFYTLADRTELIKYHHKIYKNFHGMTDRLDIFKKGDHTIIHREKGAIKGYFNYKIVRNDDTANPGYDLIINNIYYDSGEVLKQFYTFLNSLQDQVKVVVLNTFDKNLAYLLKNPSTDKANNFASDYLLETNSTALGVMYKIFDPKKACEEFVSERVINSNLNLKIKLCKDGKNKEFELGVKRNKATATLKIDLSISDFSSLFMGAISFNSLLSLGLAKISDQKFAGIINEIFKTKELPVCNIYF